MREKYTQTSDTAVQNNVARMKSALNFDYVRRIQEFNHPRWWEFSIAPPTPIPRNVRYQCEASLGSPSTANCEAVLYEFLRSGDITLDPAKPIIKQSGT